MQFSRHYGWAIFFVHYLVHIGAYMLPIAAQGFRIALVTSGGIGDFRSDLALHLLPAAAVTLVGISLMLFPGVQCGLGGGGYLPGHTLKGGGGQGSGFKNNSID